MSEPIRSVFELMLRVSELILCVFELILRVSELISLPFGCLNFDFGCPILLSWCLNSYFGRLSACHFIWFHLGSLGHPSGVGSQKS